VLLDMEGKYGEQARGQRRRRGPTCLDTVLGRQDILKMVKLERSGCGERVQLTLACVRSDDH